MTEDNKSAEDVDPVANDTVRALDELRKKSVAAEMASKGVSGSAVDVLLQRQAEPKQNQK